MANAFQVDVSPKRQGFSIGINGGGGGYDDDDDGYSNHWSSPIVNIFNMIRSKYS